MNIVELGYVLVGAPDVAQWRTFGTEVIGAMAASGPAGALYLKIDPRAFRIAVLPGRPAGLVASGWFVASERDFVEARDALQREEVAIQNGDADGAELRKVQGYFSFEDPAGHRHEIAWGPISDFTPFVSPVGVSGFVTEGMGLGHVVLAAVGPRFDAATAFWTKPGRFQLSDILHIPSPGGGRARINFLHCDNPRQHSLALGELEVPGGCIHMMLEVASLDDVGRCLDRIQAHKIPMVATLGRHVNDEMISFYVQTPGGFALEYGVGGKRVDWKDHIVFETTRGSDWGHNWVS